MQDQDEIYEAATETPASLGCPSLVPGAVVVHDEPGAEKLADVAPDYEMLARELTRDGFDADRLAKAIEAEASKRPIDYPTFYTPGWLAELAKKMQSEDKAAKTKEWIRKHYSFCDGIFPIRFTNTEDGQMASCWINGRHFTLDLDNNERDDGGHDCAAIIRDNGKVVVTIETQRGKAISGRVAYGAYKGYVRNLSGGGKYSSRGGFLKQALKRTAAAKAAQAGEVA